MHPILFEASTTDFTTNGIGRLSDTISYTVHEERNGVFELELVYPITGIHFADVKNSNIIFAKPNDYQGNQAFRIYKVTRPISGQITAYAEQISYQANWIPVMPFSGSSMSDTLAKIKSYSAETNPFTLYSDIESYSATAYTEPMSMRSILGGVRGSLLDVYGGEYVWDNWKISLLKARGQDNGVVLKYGKNITDFEQEDNIENTYTGLCPYWADNEGNNLVTLPEKVLHTENANNFPFQRTMAMNFNEVYDEQPTVDQLRESAQKYMEDNNIGIPSVSIDVSFVPLWQQEEYKDLVDSLQKVRLCDTVTVEFEKLGVSAKAKVIAYDYDGLKERYTSISIGDAKSSLAKTILEQNAAIGDIKVETAKAMKNATDWLTNSNGYVVAVKNEEDGSWKELLFLDAPSTATAQKVLRINENGLGFSSNGINGPYAQSWTLNGILSIGGANNAFGWLRILDEDGDSIVSMSKNSINWEFEKSVSSKYHTYSGRIKDDITLSHYEGTSEYYQDETSYCYYGTNSMYVYNVKDDTEAGIDRDRGIYGTYLGIHPKGPAQDSGNRTGVEISPTKVYMFDSNLNWINELNENGIYTRGAYYVTDSNGTHRGVTVNKKKVVMDIDIDWDEQYADWEAFNLVTINGIVV